MALSTAAADVKTLVELKTLLKNLPRLDEELDVFSADLEDIPYRGGNLNVCSV